MEVQEEGMGVEDGLMYCKPISSTELGQLLPAPHICFLHSIIDVHICFLHSIIDVPPSMKSERV